MDRVFGIHSCSLIACTSHVEFPRLDNLQDLFLAQSIEVGLAVGASVDDGGEVLAEVAVVADVALAEGEGKVSWRVWRARRTGRHARVGGSSRLL